MLPHAIVNYSLQISNTTDFSNILYEQTDILESETITSTNILVNISIGQYYWRIQPIYGPFSGNWTDYFTFILDINEFYPQYSDVTIPTNNIYAPNGEYTFNCTWIDIGGTIEEVKLEFNSQNYTVISSVSGEFSYTLNDLTANENGYDFRWHARDNGDVWNSTEWLAFVLNKQDVQLNLTFNGLETGYFLINHVFINITVYNYDSAPGILRLYVDKELKNDTIGDTLILANWYFSGTYNVTTILADENYTGYIMKWLIIKPKPTSGGPPNPNPGIPGYDILLMLSIIIILSSVIIKKRFIQIKK